MKRLATLIITFCSLVTCALASDGIEDILYTEGIDKVLALSFVGVPADEIETKRKAIKGDLADPELASFSIKLLKARNEKSWELAQAIIHTESLDLLDSQPGDLQILPFVHLLESGELLYLQSNPKFFITEQNVGDEDLVRFFQNHSITPTRSLVFYHYDKEKSMLVGTKFFLADEDGQPKIQLQARTLKK